MQVMQPDPVLPSPFVTTQPVRELWRLERKGATWSCELRPAGEGVEAEILRNGRSYARRRFQLRDTAVLWAAIEKEEL
jgi:hypothetical protein